MKRGWRFVLTAAALLAGAAGGLFGFCGPFTDVSDAAFCPFVLEIFYLGITTGTTPTTYAPAQNVSRLQMAAFLSRTVDSVLRRSSRRALLGQFWIPTTTNVLSEVIVGQSPIDVQFDGLDLWVVNEGVTLSGDGTVSRVRASSGNYLDTWTGMSNPLHAIVAMGKVLVTGNNFPAKLYAIDPAAPAGVVTTVATTNDVFPVGIAFDGGRFFLPGSPGVWLVTPGPTLPWTSTAVTAGFNWPQGAIYDGSNVWVTDGPAGTLLKLDSAGAILQTVTVGTSPTFPLFDGTSIWVPNSQSNSVTVIRASTGAVLATLTGNGLARPSHVAFDGERILVTDVGDPQGVSLWKAADLTPQGSFLTNGIPSGAASDGTNFWFTLVGANTIARY